MNLYSFMWPNIDQSERGYSVRHGVYVRGSTNQSTAIAYVTGRTYTLFDQSEHGYSVRHEVYVRFSTNQSTGIA